MYHVLVVEQGWIKFFFFLNKLVCFFVFSIENFIKSLIEYHHQGLEPLVMNEEGSITVKKMFSSNPENIYTLLYIHG